MSQYTLSNFIASTREKEGGDQFFELESDRLLQVNLNKDVWMKVGAMVAYRGQVKFTREKLMEHGMGNFLKKNFVTGEGVSLTKAEGNGAVYLADAGKKVSILELQDETFFVNGNDILAFETGMTYEIKMMRKVAAMLAGGLFNIELRGSGLVAITTHYEPLTLPVTPENPVSTDPNATVAWSGSLTPEFKTDVSFKTFLGRGSGESLQMFFQGEGFVIVQPYEEVTYQAAS